ncbi:MAG: BNR-4 repeat-containing protein [Novosphingobium sp.]
MKNPEPGRCAGARAHSSMVSRRAANVLVLSAIASPFIVPTELALATLPQGAAMRRAQLADGFTGIWYEIVDDNNPAVVKYGGGFSTYPQQIEPMAIYVASRRKTFFATSLDRGDGKIVHAVSFYDHRTRLLARPRIWIEKGTGDAHDAPAIAFDAKGRLLLFSNTHGEHRRASIFRSVKPYDIDRFEELLDPADPADFRTFGSLDADGQPVLRFSYGQPWKLADGRLLFIHTRYTHLDSVVGGERDLWWTMGSDGKHWSAPQRLAHIEQGQYAVSWPRPHGAGIGVAFDYHPAGHRGAPLDWRTDLFYLQTTDGLSWQNAQGETLVAPERWLTEPANPARVFDAPGDQRVYIKDINYTPRGEPVILFLTSPTHLPSPDPRQLKTASFSKGEWTIRDVLITDHDYDHGSLYIEGDVWTIIGAFLPGPQHGATGGRIGEWRSTDFGRSWQEVRRFEHAGERNDTYVRRPLNADPQFWAFWADGDAEKKSGVDLYFADRDGHRYRLPRSFPSQQMFAAPEPLDAAQ